MIGKTCDILTKQKQLLVGEENRHISSDERLLPAQKNLMNVTVPNNEGFSI